VIDGGVWYESSRASSVTDFDPFLTDMTEQELREYHAVNSRQLGKTDSTPDWVRDLIAANQI
jgi:hypothetical protein